MEKAQENQSPKGTLKMVSSRAMYTLSSFSLKTPVIYTMQFEWLTSISWPKPSSPFFSPFVIRDKIKAQAQLDANRFRP